MSKPENMSEEIWRRQAGEISEDDMRDYLDGKLSKADQRELELKLSDRSPESDAIEGLQQMNSGERAAAEARIAGMLSKRVKGMKRNRRKYYNDQRKAVIGLIVIFMLIMVGWYVIHLMTKK